MKHHIIYIICFLHTFIYLFSLSFSFINWDAKIKTKTINCFIWKCHANNQTAANCHLHLNLARIPKRKHFFLLLRKTSACILRNMSYLPSYLLMLSYIIKYIHDRDERRDKVLHLLYEKKISKMWLFYCFVF